jgi:hypothetical protein
MATNPRAVIGGNNPPEPFDAISIHVADLVDLASGCLHGGTIDTPEKAAAIDGIIDDIRAAEKALETERKALVKPFDDGKKAIQELAKPLATKLDIAKRTALDAVAPFRKAEQEARDAEAKAKREEAEKLAAEALAAFQASNVTDLDARMEAEELAAKAKKAAAAANKIDRTATGLRSYWTATVTDPGAFLGWLKTHRADELKAWLSEQATRECNAGQRAMAGVLCKEEKRAI